MEVSVKTSDDLKVFTGSNAKGQTLELGNGTAVSPMESLLMAAAGCSTIDIVMILEKMRQPVENIEVKVTGTRTENIPRIFTSIHMHYILKGKLKETKVEKAINSSLEKYCSVSIMLGKVAKVSSSFKIID